MTALENAKRFIRTNAAKTALVIVPLAMASSANASPIVFNVGGATASLAKSSTMSGTGGPGTFSPLANGGIHYTGGYAFEVAPAPSGSGVFFLAVTLSGTGNDELLDVDSIAAHYDYAFSLMSGSSLSSFVSSVTFFINGTNVGSSGPRGATSAGNVSLTGWDLTETLSDWRVVLRADFRATDPASFLLNIPSIDITPAAPDVPGTTVPEPASLLLLATGAGLFALVTRRLRPSRP